MNRKEFLEGLRKALSSTGSNRLIYENLQFYQEYIEEEVAKGYSEAEVLEELGDPRFIANSIKESLGINDEFIGLQEDKYSKETDSHTYGNERSKNYEQSKESYYQTEEKYQSGYRKNVENDKILKQFHFRIKFILYFLLVVMIIGIIGMITLAGYMIKLVWPILVPMIAIGIIVRLIYMLGKR